MPEMASDREFIERNPNENRAVLYLSMSDELAAQIQKEGSITYQITHEKEIHEKQGDMTKVAWQLYNIAMQSVWTPEAREHVVSLGRELAYCCGFEKIEESK